ncbi:hypothetical protein J8I26_04060 [Herbaspirillum sp. LeCh32-8]|uniref:hypothetical protein n=1 Tax=Herbaspirillum sp. LeCh32-8 TaxID=2821356 RepID=UPI001AE2ED28|nr:hypothetical protein [Herbaspirillum sp. LeCh32-8]MBP0597264.1 hypothetical protein [Herbaspirillum sp. LeCh32-8]
MGNHNAQESESATRSHSVAKHAQAVPSRAMPINSFGCDMAKSRDFLDTAVFISERLRAAPSI